MYLSVTQKPVCKKTEYLVYILHPRVYKPFRDPSLVVNWKVIHFRIFPGTIGICYRWRHRVRYLFLMIENVNSKSETGDPRGSFYPIDD